MHLDYLWSIYSIKIKNKPFNKNVNCRGKGHFKKTKNNEKKFSLKKKWCHKNNYCFNALIILLSSCYCIYSIGNLEIIICLSLMLMLIFCSGMVSLPEAVWVLLFILRWESISVYYLSCLIWISQRNLNYTLAS